MSTTLEQFREAKSQYLKLKTQAKKDLLVRFNALSNELLQVQKELLDDFGEKVPLPTAKPKKAAARPAKAAKSAEPEEEEAPAAPSPKIVAIERQIEKMKKKLAETKAAGKPVKVVEDRIYELEDELRLAQA